MELAGTLSLTVPDICLPHIARQRTELNQSRLVDAYRADIAADMEGIRPYLPDKVSDVLDIGCGMAGIDVLLQKETKAFLHLMDGSGASKIQAGYHTQALETWNDMSATQEMMKSNRIKHYRIYDPNPKIVVPCDVIISLLSWGHHYPTSVYARLAATSLMPGGVVIMDNRVGMPLLSDADPAFYIMATIPGRGINAKKSRRTVYGLR